MCTVYYYRFPTWKWGTLAKLILIQKCFVKKLFAIKSVRIKDLSSTWERCSWHTFFKFGITEFSFLIVGSDRPIKKWQLLTKALKIFKSFIWKLSCLFENCYTCHSFATVIYDLSVAHYITFVYFHNCLLFAYYKQLAIQDKRLVTHLNANF